MFYVVSRIITEDEAAGIVAPDAKTYVRTVDTVTGVVNDYDIDSLTKYISDGVLELENAMVENDKFTMINGDLSGYGTIIPHGNEPADIIDLKPVVLAEIVDGNTTIGFWFASPDGELYEYTIEETEDCVQNYGCANGELIKSADGSVYMSCKQKPLPIFENEGGLDDEDAEETAESFMPYMEGSDNSDESASTATVGLEETKALPDNSAPVVSDNSLESSSAPVVSDNSLESSSAPVAETSAPEEDDTNSTIWELTVFKNGKRETLTFDIADTEAEFDKLGLKGVQVIKKKDAYIAYTAITEGCRNSSITEIKFPACIDIVGTSFCENWSALTTVTLGSATSIIMPGAFNGCTNLASVFGMESVRYIDNMAFAGCRRLMNSSDSTFTFGNDLEVIGYGAFANCVGFQTMELPDSVRSVKSFAFSGMTGLVNAHVPKSVLKHWAESWEVYTSAVENKTLTSDTVDCIGVFKGCEKLATINIREKDIKVFNDFIFKGCTALIK